MAISRKPILLFGKYLMLSAMAIVAACVSTRSVAPTPGEAARPQPQVILGDASLRRALVIESVDTRDMNGMLQAQVVVRNTTRREMAVVYRFVWTDRDNFDVPTGNEIWQEAYISGYSTDRISAVATSDKAVSYCVEIKSKK